MELVKDELKIKIFDTRERMGRAAADDVAFCIKKLLAQKECINMIFAAASPMDTSPTTSRNTGMLSETP